MKIAFLPLVAALLVAGCGNDPELVAETDDNRGAEGEISGGTISDSMLPLGTVRSQAPRLSETETGEARSGGDSQGAEPSAPEAEETEADSGASAEDGPGAVPGPETSEP